MPFADRAWLHDSNTDAGRLGADVFFNGVVHALKGSKVHQNDDEAIYVPAKTLAFLVLAVGGPLHLSLVPMQNM